MAQWVRVLAAKSEGLSLIPAIHVVEGKNQPPKGTSLLQMYTVASSPASTAAQKINTCKNSDFIIFKSVEVCVFAYGHGHVSAGAQGDWSCE